MAEERFNSQSQENDNMKTNENNLPGNDDRFESDTQKIIHRHLENKNDIITDEDIANVRVGMASSQFDQATEARFEGESTREKAENDLLAGTEDLKKDENLDKGQITPWDTIDPTK